LKRTLTSVMETRAEKDAAAAPEHRANRPAAGFHGDNDGALWLLRQLRPVSYSFRKGFESKYMRFGFIADELETVVPEVVRTAKKKDYDDQKSVMYQDLIALLTAATQSQQTIIEELTRQMASMQGQLNRLAEIMAAQQGPINIATSNTTNMTPQDFGVVAVPEEEGERSETSHDSQTLTFNFRRP